MARVNLTRELVIEKVWNKLCQYTANPTFHGEIVPMATWLLTSINNTQQNIQVDNPDEKTI